MNREQWLGGVVNMAIKFSKLTFNRSSTSEDRILILEGTHGIECLGLSSPVNINDTE